MHKKFKVMAYHRSTGVWDCCKQIRLRSILESGNEGLTEELSAWQAAYDAQFRKYTYEFDWDAFNQQGRDLTAKIQSVAPHDAEIYYVESDDRDFFNPEDCTCSERLDRQNNFEAK